MEKELDVTTGSVVKIFFKYTIPTMIGMIAISSAAITNGIFVGRFIGPDALAVINLVIPFISLLLGTIIMLGSGGCVVCGKLIGEKKEKEASTIFSQIILIMLVLSLVVSAVVLVFPYKTAQLLGANPDIAPSVVTFINNYSYFIPLQFLGIGISFFARVNGKPGLASFALLFSAVMNVVLDWIFIVDFNMGISGAALATGISQAMTFFILLPSFFSAQSNLRFIIPDKITKKTFFPIFNGISEFLNEASGGIVVFVFNHVLIVQSGIEGVAAFTVVNYFLYSGCLISYSVVASIHGPVSINFGAGLIERTRDFLKTAVFFNLCLGAVIAFSLLLLDTMWIQIFFKDGGGHTGELATRYIHIIWFAFFINGINIVFSGYFTSLQKPAQALTISSLRSLVIPVGLILVLSHFFKDETIFFSIPVAEAVTLIVTIILFKNSTIGEVTKLIERSDQG